MKGRCIILCVVLVLNCIWSNAQERQNVDDIVQKLVDAVLSGDAWSYEVILHTKFFEGDSFDIRKFRVAFRNNPQNDCYAYDWMISELRGGAWFTCICIPGGFIRMHDVRRVVSYTTMMVPFEQGSYYETIRSYCILDDAIKPFQDVGSNDIVFQEAEDGAWHLSRNLNDLVTRELIIDKQSYLPLGWKSTIREKGTGLEQVIFVEFDRDSLHNSVLPGTFSAEEEIAEGYELSIAENAPEVIEGNLSVDVEEMRQILFTYPFISELADTVLLSSCVSDYILLDFWYASCLPCLLSMPRISELAEQYAGRVSVFGVNCFDKEIRSSLLQKIRAKEITLPVLFGDSPLLREIGIHAFPAYLLIDRNGSVQKLKGLEEVESELRKRFGE